MIGRIIDLPIVVFAAALASTIATRAVAQDSREELLAEAQARKATELRPYEPNKAERIFLSVKRELIDQPSGLYPLFGSVYSGGGFAVGGGYRRFVGDRTFWDVKSLVSIRASKFVEASITAPGHVRTRVDLVARAGWRDATHVAFYGLGNDSSDSRSDFRLTQAYAAAELTAKPVRVAVLQAAASYEDFTTASERGRVPSITDAHSLQSAPGLGASPSYLHSSVSAGFDWRPAPGYAERGGLYRIGYHHYGNHDGDQTFKRLDLDLVQHVPLAREAWVASFRGQVRSAIGDDRVPYFLLPSLGGGDTLRGFSSWRFRDRHSLLVSAEWRWMTNPLGMDMAVFLDAGKVAGLRKDLDFSHLKTSVGIGARFHSASATPLRIELARSREGLRIVFTGGAAF